jgi:hypothetical protein
MLAQSHIAKGNTCRFGVAGMMTLVACLVAGRAPARAESPIQASGDDPVLGCLANTTGTISVSPQTIRLGEGVTVRWTVRVPTNCTDGRSDVLWRDAGGQLAVWPAGIATGAGYPSHNNLGAAVDSAWVVQGIADYNGDARADILWRHSDGQVAVWFMAGARFLGDSYPRMVDQSWRIKAVLTYPR